MKGTDTTCSEMITNIEDNNIANWTTMSQKRTQKRSASVELHGEA